MRICLVGDYSNDKLDEGMKNIANKLYESFKQNNLVYAFNLDRIYTFKMWKGLRKFEPEIIFYIPGPSFFSFVFLAIMKIFTKKPKTVIFATHPKINVLERYFIRFFKPDLVLTQSKQSELLFKKSKIKTKFFPNGVDTDKFHPVTKQQKTNLRKKWDIDSKRYTILHVGHIKSNRNIEILSRLNRKDNQVILVGSTSTQAEKELELKLRRAGCIVFNKYIEHIEEIYQLADVYIFPTVDQESSIEIPLSVLEALSCNLPVITTKFRGLPTVFEEGDGLIFIDNEDKFIDVLGNIESTHINVKTRDKVLPYSWENITEELESVCEGMVPQKYEKKGVFICFTGMDGAGKTTLAKFIVKDLQEGGIKASYVYSRYVPIILRPVMLLGKLLFFRNKDFYRDYSGYSDTKKRASKRHNILAGFYQHLLLFDYFFQILFKIKLPLLFGKNIISDRYIYDTIVTDLSVDFNYSEEDVKKILNKILSLFPTPDITFLIDLPEEIAYQRKDDVPSIKYLRDRRKTYLFIGKECEMILLDGSMPLDEVKSAVKGNVWRVTNE